MKLWPVRKIGVAIVLLLASAGVRVGAAPPVNADDQVPWREMRLLWRTPIVPSEEVGENHSDLILSAGRLFRAGAGEAACIDPSSGTTVWRQRLLPATPQSGDDGGALRWYLSISGDSLYLTASYSQNNVPTPPAYVWSIDAVTGVVRWKRWFDYQLLERAVPAAGVVLVSTRNGRILALRSTDGALVWDQQWVRPEPSEETPVFVAADGDVGVLKVRGNDLIGFRVSDGHNLWHIRRGTGREAAATGRVAVKSGVAYTWLAGRELTAVRLRSGHVLWRHTAWVGAPVGEPQPQANGILLDGYWQSTMVDARRGRTLWLTGTRSGWSNMPIALDDANAPLLERISTLPRIEGEARSLSSLMNLDAVTAVDPRTGRHLWQWQPQEGVRIDRAFADGVRLLVSTGHEVLCYGPGSPVPLPAEAALRRRLATLAVEQLYGNSHLAWGPSGRLVAFRIPAEEQECLVTLLRLGSDGVPALLDQLRNRLEVADREPIPANELRDKQQPVSPGSHEEQILNLLADIGDPAVPDQLTGLAEQVKQPRSRDLLAKALVRYGDVRAAPYLFRYALRPDVDPIVQQSALRFACRAGNVAGLDQAAVTRFLLDALHREAPVWLRHFSLFELLNDRGEETFQAALQVLRREQERPIPREDPEVALEPQDAPRRVAREIRYPALPQNETEGIYQAVLDGLCVLGRMTLVERAKLSRWLDGGPPPFGRDSEPLILPLPRGSRGIEVRGHPGGVRFNRATSGFNGLHGPFRGNFAPPSIRLDGTWQDTRWDSGHDAPHDPFRPPPGHRDRPAFRDFFPYEISADRTRVRIGWLEDSFTGGSARFDVEVRKHGSRWYPTECREVGSYYQFTGWELPVPIRTLSKAVPLDRGATNNLQRDREVASTGGRREGSLAACRRCGK